MSSEDYYPDEAPISLPVEDEDLYVLQLALTYTQEHTRSAETYKRVSRVLIGLRSYLVNHRKQVSTFTAKQLL